MTVIESYTPEYVLRLQEQVEPCRCAFCQQRPARVVLRWQHQARHSAWLGCDRAARAILCQPDAFVLHQGETAGTAAAPLDERLEACNQACINLLIASEASLDVKLYALGIFLSKAQQIKEPTRIGALADELGALLASGEMAQAFAQLPAIMKYKLAALRALSESELEADLDPLSGMALVLKLNEMRVMANGYLEETLHELESSAALAAFMQSHAGLFVNYLLWECYHNLFPGDAAERWEARFHHLCLNVFSLKMLCAVFLQNELELDDSTLSALFAAWQRASCMDQTAADQPALLVGLSLLQPAS